MLLCSPNPRQPVVEYWVRDFKVSFRPVSTSQRHNNNAVLGLPLSSELAASYVRLHVTASGGGRSGLELNRSRLEKR